MDGGADMITIPRESVEFVGVDVLNDDNSPVTNFDVCVTPINARPTTWLPVQTVEDTQGVLIQGLTPGHHIIWVRVTSTPETVVLAVATIRIS